MAKIAMTGGFSVIPEGTYVFRIYAVEFIEEFGKLTVKMVNAKGQTHQERFGLMRNDGTANEGAMAAFSILAKNALNDFSMADCDPMDLVDHYVKATVEHEVKPNRNDPTKTVTFVHLNDKSPATGFDIPAVPKALNLGHEAMAPAPETPAAPATPAGGLDLNALLNM